MRQQSRATKAENHARILAAFPFESTSYPTARELAAAIDMPVSTLGDRLAELLTDGQLVREADGIHRPRPGPRWDWETARAAGERRLKERVNREDLERARRPALQRVTAARAVLDEAAQTFGDRALQSVDVAGDREILNLLGKRLEQSTSVQDVATMVDEAFATLRCPIDEWTAAVWQRDHERALEQAEVERQQAQVAYLAAAAAYVREVAPIFGLPLEWALERVGDSYLQPGGHLPGFDGCGPSANDEVTARAQHDVGNPAPYALCVCGSPWTWTAGGWRPGYPNVRSSMADLRRVQKRAELAPRMQPAARAAALPPAEREPMRGLPAAAADANGLVRFVQGLGIRF